MKKFNITYIIIFLFIIISSSCNDDSVINPGTGDNILPADNILSIYIDNQDIKWFGTTAGLVCYNGKTWTIYNKTDGVAGDSINAIAHQLSLQGNEIWTATNSGSSVHSYDVDGITAATIYHPNNSGLSSDIVNTVAIDKDDTRWFATQVGLSVFAGQLWLNKTYSHKKIVCIGTLTDGWNYMGTLGSGVARYKIDSVDGITGASLINTDWSGIPNNNVLSIFIDNDNNQWYGTKNGAAFHIGSDTREDWTVYTTDDGLISNTILSIFKDSKEIIWFGTDKGLTSKDGDEWVQYSTDNGLSSNIINAIAEDEVGNIWFATDNGISMYDGIGWVVYN